MNAKLQQVNGNHVDVSKQRKVLQHLGSDKEFLTLKRLI